MRGRPPSAIGPHTAPGCGRGRPRTSQCSASARCADLPVRNWASHRPGCGRGRPRTSQCSAAARCADLPVRNWASHRAGMRTRTSAHLPVFGVCAVRGPPGPQLGLAPAGMRTRTSAHLPVFGGGAVRGPPGPHWASHRAGMRTRTSAHLQSSAAGRGARTSRSAIGPRAGRGCGRGRPRTSQCPAAARCADLPVRNWASHRAGMRTRTSAHLAGFGGGGCADVPVRISGCCAAHRLRGTNVRTGALVVLRGTGRARSVVREISSAQVARGRAACRIPQSH